ncbi:ABC transporter substrate-binding protein [Halosegnis marinus]|uniref:Thiamine pyrimidine synthase n=1 Tax=Halosegnis marinus TaxID=3034023 RepID=A0ABD5ZPH5_9EURY|nr:ABC transporter substrate-binding protein [Halosegnis sp. DT85]
MDVTVALDWTPNTNHAGFYVAADRGAYADAGLDVTLESPALDGYERTPARKVAEGEADFAVAPSESAVSYATLDRHDSLVAVAALVQGDTSAVAVLADSDIERPRDLDGATYASYGARFEDHIVAQLIRNDGGEGTFETVEPEMLGVPNTLLDGDADATWVFMPWEGVRARRDGIDLRGFGLSEYDVPYGYTPVLLAHPDTLDEHGDAVREFLAATAEGYEAAAADPEGAADTLCRIAEGPDLDDPEFVRESARELAPHYLADGEWGHMDGDRWARFVDWLRGAGVLDAAYDEGVAPPAPDDLYTNAYL